MSDDIFHNGGRYVLGSVYASTDYSPTRPGVIVKTKEYRPGSIPIGTDFYSDPFVNLTSLVESLSSDVSHLRQQVDKLRLELLEVRDTAIERVAEANRERDQWMVLVEDLRDIQ